MGENDDQKTAEIKVPSKDAEKEKDKDKNTTSNEKKQGVRLAKGKKKAQPDDDLSEEDRKRKEELELLVCAIIRSTHPSQVTSLTQHHRHHSTSAAAASGSEFIQAVRSTIIHQTLLSPDEMSKQEAKALELVCEELKAATSSMTSVPKPLKFLRGHYALLEEHYNQIDESHNKASLADVLSVLATTVTSTDPENIPRPSLHYRLRGTGSEVTGWGHEYLRNLSGEISAEYAVRLQKEASVEDLVPLIDAIVPFNMNHHAEWDAIDLLCETERIENIKPHISEHSCLRVELYLTDVARYAGSLEETNRILGVAADVLIDKNELCRALRVSFRMDDAQLATRVINEAALCYRRAAGKVRNLLKKKKNDEAEALTTAKNEHLDIWLTLKQLALLSTRHRAIQYEWSDINLAPQVDGDEAMAEVNEFADGETDDQVLVSTGNPVGRPSPKHEAPIGQEVKKVDPAAMETSTADDTETESRAEYLVRLNRGDQLHQWYRLLGQELDVMEPKRPEDVYKSKLDNSTQRMSVGLASATANLAATMVNAMVNLGFRADCLMLPVTSEASSGAQSDNGWLYKNKDHAMFGATASLGALLLWHMEEGLAKIDKFQWDEDVNVRGGAFMALGLVHSGIRSEFDPVYPILSEQLQKPNLDSQVRIGTVLGLGLAYAGTCRSELFDDLVPIIIESTVKVSAMTALALGFVFIGSCHEGVAEAIIQTLIDRQTDGSRSLDGAVPRYYAVALGLLFLSKRDACEAVLDALLAVEHPLAKYAAVTVEGCAYAGTGDVIKIQKMLQKCVEQPTPTTETDEMKDDEAPPKPQVEATEGSVGDAPSGTGTGTCVDKPATSGPSTSAPSAPAAGSGEEGGKAAEPDKLDQAVAVLSIPLIAMGEEVGSDMSVRMMDHLLQYADLPLRRAVPLALALYSCSNPRPALVDTLSKLSHDFDMDVALHAIIGHGLVGAVVLINFCVNWHLFVRKIQMEHSLFALLRGCCTWARV
eukprot:GHVN01083669.1.p1 GENE.GHVN01083669.1~~GHVN01083669.1.p1  ORF type:complete len:991 (+),score=210.55 GHVN01083669.1:1033-4005(+)